MIGDPIKTKFRQPSRSNMEESWVRVYIRSTSKLKFIRQMDFGDEEGTVFLQFVYEHLKNFCTLCGSILHHHLLCDLEDFSDSDSDSDDDQYDPPPSPPPEVIRSLSSFFRTQPSSRFPQSPLIPSTQPPLLSTPIRHSSYHVGESFRQNRQMDNMHGNWDPSLLSGQAHTRVHSASDNHHTLHSAASMGSLSHIVGFCSTTSLLRGFSSHQPNPLISSSLHPLTQPSTITSPIPIPGSAVAATLDILQASAAASALIDSRHNIPMDLNKASDLDDNLEVMSPTPITIIPPVLPPIITHTNVSNSVEKSISSKESSASVPSLPVSSSKKRKFEDTGSPSSPDSPQSKRRFTLSLHEAFTSAAPAATLSGEVDTPKPPPAK